MIHYAQGYVMLKTIAPSDPATVVFTFEGQKVKARENDTVASALLAAGEIAFRATPVSGASRGPFCMMGVCFECLVEIDGRPNRQACMLHVTDGMVVCRQNGVEEVERP